MRESETRVRALALLRGMYIQNAIGLATYDTLVKAIDPSPYVRAAVIKSIAHDSFYHSCRLSVMKTWE